MPSQKFNDFYSRKARKEKFAARSVYKLEEIDSSISLLGKGQKVLDLGSSPGSWMQYVSGKVDAKGKVIGIDLKPLNIALAENMEFYQMPVEDLLQQNDHPIFAGKYDRILSDMAPKTTGVPSGDSLVSFEICGMAVGIADICLKNHGSLLMKNFQGSKTEELISILKGKYARVKIFKPQGTRSESREIFILARRKKPSNG